MMRALTLVMALVLGVSASAAEPPKLANNPFSRPPKLIVTDAMPRAEDLDGAPLLLIATMVTSQRTMANVEGSVLHPGDEIRGYVLQRVFEDRAIFKRNDDQIVVYVKPQLEEDDEQPTPRNRRR